MQRSVISMMDLNGEHQFDAQSLDTVQGTFSV